MLCRRDLGFQPCADGATRDARLRHRPTRRPSAGVLMRQLYCLV
jgi:hypothetical protein